MNNTKTQEPLSAKDLAEAASMHARATNRIWFATAAASMIVLLPRTPAPNQSQALPLGLGEVSIGAFDLAIFALLAVLTISFAATHAQHLRAWLPIHRQLDAMIVSGDTTARELFDLLRQSSVNRLAPLALLPDTLYRDFTKKPIPSLLRRALQLQYVILKLAADGLFLFLPAYALWRVMAAVNAQPNSGMLVPALNVFAWIALFSLAETAVSDLISTFRTVKHLAT